MVSLLPPKVMFDPPTRPVESASGRGWTSVFVLAALGFLEAACAPGGSSDTGGSGGVIGSGGVDASVTTGSGGRIGSGGTPGSGGISGTGGSAGRAGTGGNMGTGGGTAGSGVVDCTPPVAGPLVGWATVAPSTTGGGTLAPTPVTTLAQLNSAAGGSNFAVIVVNGSLTGSVSIGSNKTIVGVCGAQIHGHVDISRSTNVILRNITIVGYGVGNCALDPSYDSTVGCSSGQDAISVQNNANHIWIDHCDISDGTDGNLDITTGANNITVSWTKFHYTPRTDNTGSDSTGGAGHRFSNLVGGDDLATGDTNALNITWHHNWWADNVVERQPRVRFGKNHLFNNLWSSAASNYCVRAGIKAEILVESNVFTGVKNPQQFNSAADQMTSFITSLNNMYTGTSGTQSVGGGGTAFTAPSYVYTADVTSGLQAAIQSGAGPK